MVDVGLETREKVASQEKQSQEKQIENCLILASDYLAAKETAAWKPESKEDLRMRKIGVLLQQRLASFILGNYDRLDSQSVEDIERRLKGFWEGYHLLVLRPLEKRGYNIKTIRKEKPDTGMELVLALKQGVWGMVTTSTLALRSGWQVEFPTAEEDVRSGIDLFLRRKDQRVPVQVKCIKDLESLRIKKEGPRLLKVTIPAKRIFFKYPEIGIPDLSNVRIFSRQLESQLAK